MKIKTKIQLKLPQLIEWGFKNDIKNKSYKTNDTEGYELYFDEYGTPRFSNIVNKNDTFTVEVEEELTEDTVFPELVELYEDTLRSNDGNNEILISENISIRRAKDEDECPSRAFYIINDDLSMTLIWRDGKLAE
ncbi:hypothetical protein QI066_12775 [Staphylococcus saprophyticus]|nr:hypothetical protein [Staphylococcus saprophyticus]